MIASDLIDKASDVREGEELDLDALKQHLEPVLGSKVAGLEIKQFPGGHSNLTYLLTDGDESWVLRRPPFGSKVTVSYTHLRAHET